jgi:hypothetical protein
MLWQNDECLGEAEPVPKLGMWDLDETNLKSLAFMYEVVKISYRQTTAVAPLNEVGQ